MSMYRVEFFDFDTSEKSMTGPSWINTIEALSPMDAIIKAADTAEPEVLEIRCGDDDMNASAYAIDCCEFEFHLYIGDSDVAFTMPKQGGAQ